MKTLDQENNSLLVPYAYRSKTSVLDYERDLYSAKVQITSEVVAKKGLRPLTADEANSVQLPPSDEFGWISAHSTNVTATGKVRRHSGAE